MDVLVGSDCEGFDPNLAHGTCADYRLGNWNMKSAVAWGLKRRRPFLAFAVLLAPLTHSKVAIGYWGFRAIILEHVALILDVRSYMLLVWQDGFSLEGYKRAFWKRSIRETGCMDQRPGADLISFLLFEPGDSVEFGISQRCSKAQIRCWRKTHVFAYNRMLQSYRKLSA